MTAHKITIIRVTLPDLGMLRELAVQTFTDTFVSLNSVENMTAYISEAFHPQKLAFELEQPNSQYWLVFAGDKPAGYLKVNTGSSQTDLKEENTLEIERIYVQKDFQQLGIGRLLMEKAYTIAKENGLASVWLGVWEENKKAIRFYEKNGLRKTGQHVFFLGVERQNDLIMKKEIKQFR